MSKVMNSAPKVGGVVGIEVKEVPGLEYLGQSLTSPLGSVGGAVQAALDSLFARIQTAGAVPAGPPFLIASQPMDGSLAVEVGVPCVAVPEPATGQHAGRLEAGKAAVALYRGPYDRIGPAYETLFGWAATHGFRPADRVREVYLNAPGEVDSPDEYLTELVLPVA
jgi:effector-binding domain-containing protein